MRQAATSPWVLLSLALGASLGFASCDTSATLDPGGSGGPGGGGARQIVSDPSLSVVVQATTEPQRILVIPGNAEDSYLVVKLEGRQTIGQRMPLGRAPLDSIDMGNLRNWIDRGAKNN
jgi:hypothetical protein